MSDAQQAALQDIAYSGQLAGIACAALLEMLCDE